MCPQLMAMGMSIGEFWDASPYLTIYYRKAFRLKRNLENEMAWVQGLYFYNAVAVCLQNVLRKRGQKKEHYVERPFDIMPLTKREKKEREREELIKTQKALEAMRSAQMAKKAKSKTKKQGGE